MGACISCQHVFIPPVLLFCQQPCQTWRHRQDRCHVCISLPSALLNVLSSLTAVPLLMSLSDSTIDTQGLISLSRFPPSPDTASWSRASTSKTQHNKKRHSDENANTSTWKLLKKNTLRENSTCNSTYSRLKTLYVKLLKENLRKHTWRNST